MRKGCQVPCADTPLPLPASVLVRGTSWDSLLCEPLIYVLRRHIVLIPPALSPPPALPCSRISKSPTSKPFWMTKLLIFPYRSASQARPCSQATLPDRAFPQIQRTWASPPPVPSLESPATTAHGPSVPLPPGSLPRTHHAEGSRPLTLDLQRLLQLVGLCCSLAFRHPAPFSTWSSFKYLHLQTLFPRGKSFIGFQAALF